MRITLRSRVRRLADLASRASARALAAFFGMLALADALAASRAPERLPDLWWIDLRFLPARDVAPLEAAAAALLVAYALRPACSPWRRRLTLAASVFLLGAALLNAQAYYAAIRAGAITSFAPFPLSLVVATLLAALTAHVARRGGERAAAAGEPFALVVALAVLAVVFPLAQVAFFGTTDYRRPADAVVVFGAKVHESGRLSTALEDRVRTAVELYHAGLVPRIIMSGGVGDSGLDEATAMKRRAEELGVPASAVLVDGAGVNTDATVADTVPMMGREAMSSLLAVSQFYHLPRIKLAYRAAGVDVRTVPASTSVPITATPFYVLREVPGFWVYWGRALMRDLAA